MGGKKRERGKIRVRAGLSLTLVCTFQYSKFTVVCLGAIILLPQLVPNWTVQPCSYRVSVY